jgi:outer membrane protein TolC
MKKLIFFFFLNQIVFAQTVLKFEDFKMQVLNNHPVSRQANFEKGRAEANVLQAKSAFDPILFLENSQKTLDNKSYFKYSLAEIVYQSPFAVKLKSGVEVSSGSFLNPEYTRGSLAFLGIEVPVLQGLLTDYKRTEVKKAVLFKSQNIEEQRAVLNNLVLESSLTYYDWATKYDLFKTLDNYLLNAKKRLDLIVLGFKNGERAQMDTVEARTQYQKILLLRNDANLDYIKSRLSLSQFLWSSENTPYYLSADVFPDSLALTIKTNAEADLISNLNNSQPLLKAYQFKRNSLLVTQSLYKQFFLPQLTLKANLLNQSNLNPEVIFAQPLNENYKFGFDFSIPLFLSDARSKKQDIKLRLLENQNMIDAKRWETEVKIKTYNKELEILSLQKQTVLALQAGYKSLLDNELLKLRNGESNLFFINSRENIVLENYVKLVEITFKLIEKSFSQQAAAGVLYE